MNYSIAYRFTTMEYNILKDGGEVIHTVFTINDAIAHSVSINKSNIAG